ncbi:hypothetical protein GCM10023097_57600 [Streptomyces collinus]
MGGVDPGGLSLIAAVRAGSVALRAGSVALRAGSVALRAGSVALRAGAVALRAGAVAVRAGAVAVRAGSVALRAGSSLSPVGPAAVRSPPDGTISLSRSSHTPGRSHAGGMTARGRREVLPLSLSGRTWQHPQANRTLLTVNQLGAEVWERASVA